MIKIIRNEKSWIENDAVEQLKKVVGLRGMIKAVGLPDLHPGKTPVGASFITKDIIYPHIAGNDIDCGMALFSVDVNRKKFKVSKVTDKLKKLDNIESINISHLLNKGFLFNEKLGTVGGGNHFAEFQEIDKIYDEEAIRKIGIDKGSILLLVHSGSRSSRGLQKYRKSNRGYAGRRYDKSYSGLESSYHLQGLGLCGYRLAQA